MLSLDHAFIITEPGADAASRLIDFGFVEGSSNVHPGQGTANRRFFLNGFTLELLYIDNAEEAASGAGRRLGILNRFNDPTTCPFGIVVRVSVGSPSPSFPHWQYYPEYFDETMCFFVGANSEQLAEPLCICMPPSLPLPVNVPIEQSNAEYQLTALELSLPVEHPSPVLEHFAAMNMLDMNYSRPYRMTMTLNNGSSGKSENLAPDLPLVLKW